MSPANTPRANTLAQQEYARRELARRRIIAYTQRLLPNYQAGWVHYDLAARLERFSQRVIRGESPRLIINMPPGTGKSEIASKIFVPWHLGHAPNHHVIAATHSDSLAIENSLDVQQYIKDPRSQTVFPDLSLDKDRKGVQSWRTAQGGRYKPVGVGQGISGFRAHVLIIDDPHKDKDAYSDTVRSSIWRWYKSSARTRLFPGGGIIIIQTRWVLDDLTGLVLEEEPDKWEHVIYEMEATKDEYRLPDGTISSIWQEGATLLRSKGELLHPERWPEEIITEHRSDPVTWQALFQQHPDAGDAAIHKRESFKLIKRADLPKNLLYYSAWDLAATTEELSAYSAGVTVGVDEDDNLYVVDVDRDRYDSLDMVEQIIANHLEYTPEVIGLEKMHTSVALGPFLDKRISEDEITDINWITMPVGNRDKVARSRSMQGRVRQGKVFVVEDAEWTEAFLAELCAFPMGRFKDQADAFHWIGIMLDDMGTPTKESDDVKKKRDSWRKKLNRYQQQRGRNWRSA